MAVGIDRSFKHPPDQRHHPKAGLEKYSSGTRRRALPARGSDQGKQLIPDDFTPIFTIISGLNPYFYPQKDRVRKLAV